MHRFLTMAIKHAAASPVMNKKGCRHSAIIVRGGSVVSVGINKPTNNRFVEYYTKQTFGQSCGYQLDTHAEMDAVLKVRGKTNLEGLKIYVARVLRDGTPGLSRPCSVCQRVLKNYGIKRAIYTISENEYGVLNIGDLKL